MVSFKDTINNINPALGTAGVVSRIEHIHWNESVPVALVASSLLTYSNAPGVGVLLEFQNLTDKTITQLYFSLSAAAADGREVRRTDNLSFLNLSVGCGETFGLDYMVRLPEPEIRNYKIIISRIVFADDTVWENTTDEPFAPLPKPTLPSSLGEMESVYRKITPEKAQRFLAESHGSWWRCGCGQINLDHTKPCIMCATPLETLLLAVNPEELELRKTAFDDEEKAAQLNEARQRRNMLFFIAAIGVLILVVAFLTVMLQTSVQ